MPNKLMYNPNDDTQNYPFCRLKLVVKTYEHSTNQNSLILPPKKITSNKQDKTLGTIAICFYLDLEPEDDGPYETQDHPRISIHHILSSNVLQSYLNMTCGIVDTFA